MRIFVVDVETTGLEAATDKVVEIASVEVVEVVADASTGLTQWRVGEGEASFVNPHQSIPLEVSAVHHIIDSDVVDAPDLDLAIDRVLPVLPGDGDAVMAAHNARFDRGFLPSLKDMLWIDTWRCALHVWPDAPRHNNQTLRYWLGIDLPRVDVHRALSDAVVTAHILCRLLNERSVDELLLLSTKAVVLKKVGFGKHFGILWTDVPDDYLRWASGKDDFDPDVKFTVKSEIARRRG